MYFGFDLKPALPFAVPACFAAKLASVAVLSCRYCKLRRRTAAISDCELRRPVVQVVGALCTAIVQIPLFCRLQGWSQAEAGSHRRPQAVHCIDTDMDYAGEGSVDSPGCWVCKHSVATCSLLLSHGQLASAASTRSSSSSCWHLCPTGSFAWHSAKAQGSLNLDCCESSPSAVVLKGVIVVEFVVPDSIFVC